MPTATVALDPDGHTIHALIVERLSPTEFFFAKRRRRPVRGGVPRGGGGEVAPPPSRGNSSVHQSKFFAHKKWKKFRGASWGTPFSLSATAAQARSLPSAIGWGALFPTFERRILRVELVAYCDHPGDT
jgi:hypothetical protein